ncbi:MAG: polyphosphate kinase 1 [Bacteroidia bacterium]
MAKAKKYIHREISWLSFNARVLQEAADESVPLIERIKFLGIFSSNLDEFFRVRVSFLRKFSRFQLNDKLLDYDANKVLHALYAIIIRQQNKFERIYKQLLEELKREKIFLIDETQLSHTQGRFIRNYFNREVLPSLVPVMIDKIKNFPFLKDKSIYLAIRLSRKDKAKKNKHALVEIPAKLLSRFVVLPKIGDNKYIILLDDIIRYCLKDIFYIFNYDTFDAWTIKLTRDAELELDNDVSENFMDKVAKSLQKRKKGLPVRFVYDKRIPKDLLGYFIKRMHLDDHDLIAGGRYHNFKDFIGFPNVGGKELVNEPLVQLPHKHLKPKRSIIKTMKFHDCLLHLPYQSFDYVIQFLREASIDPKVKEIKITLYRVAQNSNIVNALINAVKNGKSVTVMMELQARFDEEANINWAKKMEEEGVKVIYGLSAMKVHCKMCLVAREEKNKMAYYANIGTGNFHEVTAKLYCDQSFFTTDKRITNEVARVFSFLEFRKEPKHFKHLIVSPFDMRQKLRKMIDKEIRNAKEKKNAYITFKLNHIVDEKMIDHLYEASAAGVKINLIVRTTCALVPGIKKISENIHVVSIVDKFLEHARIYSFCNNDNPRYFLSSGDLMFRNLNQRVEVSFPIYDEGLKKEIQEVIDIQLSDNTKARIINANQDNHYKKDSRATKVRTQVDVYNFLKELD